MRRYAFSSWRAIVAARRLRRLRLGERAEEVGAVADRRQALHRHEPVVDRVGRLDHRPGVGEHAGEIALQALDPRELARRQQRLAPVAARSYKSCACRHASSRLLELARAPGEEVGQPELHDRAARIVGGALEQAVDRTQRPDGDGGVRLGAVVDQPLRARVHRLEDLQPALVVGRQQLDELGLQVERLPERLSPLGLAHGVQQHLDRLGVAALGGAGEVQRRLGQVPGSQQRAPRLPVQDPPPGAARRLVDDVANERVVELVAQLAAALLLDHDPRLDELGQHRPDLLERARRQRRQVAERHRPPHHRQALQHAARCRVESAQLRRDAVGEPFGQAPQMRSLEIAPLLHERPQQADGEQRIALRALREPVHQRAGAGPPMTACASSRTRRAPAARPPGATAARPGRARTAPARRRRAPPARRGGSWRGPAAGRRRGAGAK